MGNEFQTPMGGGLLGISKKIIFIFKTRQKMLTKFGQFKKLKCREGSQLCKLSQLCHRFCRVLKMKIFFLISLAIPRPLRSGIHWPINFTKKIMFLYIFNKQKSEKKFRDPSLLFCFAFFFGGGNIQNHKKNFGKFDWSMNSGPRWAGDC